jgi:CheY-like chemotaxis protein
MAQRDGVNQFANLRIALIEDEALVVMLLEDMLSELGCHVVGTAAHLNEAIQLADSTDADVAILDVNLDGHEAYAVAERLAAREIPFVFATGYGRQGLRAGFGNRPTLQKPFRIEDLRRVISEALFGADRSRAGEIGS